MIAPVSRTAFLFPGLDSMRRPADVAPILALPRFEVHWRAVAGAYGELTQFRACDAALRAADAEVLFSREVVPITALAIAAMQTASAEELTARGFHADVLCGYSLGDVARTIFAGCGSFAQLVGFARALPLALPWAAGLSVVAASPDTPQAIAAGAITLAAAGASVSWLSPRVVTFSGAAEPMRAAAAELRALRWRTRELIGCALHAPEQHALSDLLGRALALAPVRDPRLPIESAVVEATLTTADEVRDELARNAMAPCDLLGAIERLRDHHGVTRIVDVGPGRGTERLMRHYDPPIATISAIDLLASE